MARQFPNRIPRAPLAPPGAVRDDQLKQRQDDLVEQAEQLAHDSEVEAANPEAFLADEELQAALAKDGSEVSYAQPGTVYMWVSVEYPASARGINVLHLTSVGWRVVKGDDPEAAEYKTVDGTRKLGDCILLKIDARKKQMLDYRIDQLNAKREGASTEALKERAAKFGIKVVNFDEMTPEQQKRIQRRSQSEFSKHAAVQKLAGNLREGTVPGVMPGR